MSHDISLPTYIIIHVFCALGLTPEATEAPSMHKAGLLALQPGGKRLPNNISDLCACTAKGCLQLRDSRGVAPRSLT